MCAVGGLDGAFCELVQCACPAGPCSLKVEVPSCAVGPLRSAEDLAPELLPRTDATTGVPIQVAASAQISIPTSQPAVWPRSPHSLPPGPPCTISLSTLRPGHQQLWPYAQCPAAAFPALGPEDAADPVAPRFPQADAQAFPRLRFRVQITPEADRCLVMDFGDGSGVQMRTHRATGDVAVTTFHRYRREGVYALQTVLYSESHGAEVRLGPYYVELGLEATSVFLNASSGLRGPMCAFGGSPTDLRRPAWVDPVSPCLCLSPPREGEFMVEVVAFNAVSTVSLRKRLFVVRRPCQPPPVKNMGPGQVQVWRSQPVTLGVTFEAAILCDISQGLSYSWSLTNSVGSPVPLPPAISTHRQTFTVPHYFLEPGNDTALAQVGGSWRRHLPKPMFPSHQPQRPWDPDRPIPEEGALKSLAFL
ncbi:PREDICTED: polycystic kidney disease protein 1-like 1 [Myotis davidii]|uniref:polycystic kidney disease protein 1-like 1 n=1 Tax=Myotis davidii TaxID=225400 RepID=UPI000766EF0E|nr:PREDICTED: polycystic kidney disease protein 1-like 1 [Myotis davidii]